jgi:PKHD-type hydroxylase
MHAPQAGPEARAARIDVAYNGADKHRMLSDAECDAVIAWAEANPAGWDKVDQPDVRYGQVAVNDRPADTISWLPQKFRSTMQALNSRLWGFHVSDIGPVVVLRYEPGDGFGLHVDFGPGHMDRKISMIVQLSAPDDYIGGSLEFGISPPRVASRGRGSLLAFPAWTVHRLTPITAGKRYVCTCFCLGEPFK